MDHPKIIGAYGTSAKNYDSELQVDDSFTHSLFGPKFRLKEQKTPSQTQLKATPTIEWDEVVKTEASLPEFLPSLSSSVRAFSLNSAWTIVGRKMYIVWT